MIKKGDTCRVRLHTGEVVEAVYNKPCGFRGIDNYRETDHWVLVGGKSMITSVKAREKILPVECANRVRFIGPSCDLIPVGVSNAT